MLTRRNFIRATIGAGVALATGAGCTTAQRERKRMIVDAQVHLWKANSPGPCVPGAKPQMPEPFTIERALPLMDEAGVEPRRHCPRP